MFITVEFCIFLLLTLSHLFAQDPAVNLPQGRIVGIKVYIENSLTPIEIFFGIPYATPPVGRYRFSAPERHSGWRRTLFAHRMPPHCPDVGENKSNHFNEDCLFLNIWTPRRADGSALPVVVILYSESWLRSGTTLPCQELAAQGVVVVTVAYRLHILAYFNLRSKLARGNLALLDQYLAFLWVRDNIAAFGGDPTAITIIGHSAGADSILHHIASPRSAGLFHRAVIMSPLDIWKTIDEKKDIKATEQERISRDIARSLRCHNTSDQEILNCMRTYPLMDIMSLYKNTNWSNIMQPVPDNYLPETERYLPTSLPTLLSNTKQAIMQIDILLGTADLEVLNHYDNNYAELMKQSPAYISEYADTKVIPELLQMFSFHQSGNLPMLIKAVHWEYWGMKTRNTDADMSVLEAIEGLARIESSGKWGAGSALLAARLARRVASLYAYRYSQPDGVNLLGQQFNFTGAVHGSDLISLLGDTLMLQVARRRATTDEKRISSLFQQYVVNFVKYGSPGAEDTWRQYTAGDANIFDINDKQNAICHQNYLFSPSKEIKFWLQYLPELSNLLGQSEQTEQLVSDRGDTRLRGGVFAMCGVSAVLLSLLCACAVLLQRERSRRRLSVGIDALQ